MGGSTEVALPFGGDFSLDATGDLALLIDDGLSSLATEQRILQMLLTNPTLRDANGRPVAPADDMFNPDNGVGEGRLIGAKVSTSSALAVKASIQKGLATFPDVLQAPGPIVNVSYSGQGQLLVSIQVTTVTGKTVSIPSERITSILS